MQNTIRLMMPLLQIPLINPHATLITLFMNAVDEHLTEQDRIADITPQILTTKRLFQYLPPKGMPMNPFDPESIKISFAQHTVATYDKVVCLVEDMRLEVVCENNDNFRGSLRKMNTNGVFLISKFPISDSECTVL